MGSNPTADIFRCRCLFLNLSTSKSLVSEHQAAIAQLGERQTEDLEVPGSIPGLGIFWQCYFICVIGLSLAVFEFNVKTLWPSG